MTRSNRALAYFGIAGVVLITGYRLSQPLASRPAPEPELRRLGASPPVPRTPSRESPQDDLEMLTALTDGATTAPIGDVLVAAPGWTIVARAADRTVVALPQDGGQAEVLVRLDAPARAMALVGDVLWLTAREQIVKVPLHRLRKEQRPPDLRADEPYVLACGIGRPRALAADARWVFVVDVEPTMSGLTRASTIVRVDIATGDAKVIGRSAGEVTNLVVDDSNVYWADRLEGSILSVSKEGDQTHALATDRGLPGSIAVGGDVLVWVEKRSESIWTMPRGGGTPRPLVRDFAGFANVVVDGRGVYWTNEAAVNGGFRVLGVALGGGETTTLSPAVASIDALAVDGARLLWDHGGRVESLERP